MGETCQSPTVVSSSGTITGQTTVGYINNIGTSNTAAALCGGYSNTGPDRVYEVTVNNGQTLTATVTPTSSWDPGIYIVQGPATNCAASGTTCLGGSDANGGGTADVATYTNSSGSAVTVFVVVDRYTSGTGGPFDLTISLMP
jgi:hypothetical protein